MFGISDKAPFRPDDMARLLRDHLYNSQTDSPVTFVIDKLLVNRNEKTADSVDVYYTVTFEGKTLNGLMQIEYNEFKRETGGFAALFEYIAKGLFNRPEGGTK